MLIAVKGRLTFCVFCFHRTSTLKGAIQLALAQRWRAWKSEVLQQMVLYSQQLILGGYLSFYNPYCSLLVSMIGIDFHCVSWFFHKDARRYLVEKGHYFEEKSKGRRCKAFRQLKKIKGVQRSIGFIRWELFNMNFYHLQIHTWELITKEWSPDFPITRAQCIMWAKLWIMQSTRYCSCTPRLKYNT